MATHSEDIHNGLTQKEVLYNNAEKYKRALEEQVDILKENAGQISKVAIVIGGTLTVSYLLFKLLTGSSKKKRKKEYYQPSAQLSVPQYKEESVIIRTIKGYIATFLIAIAQQKLQEVIAHFKENNAEEDSREYQREKSS